MTHPEIKHTARERHRKERRARRRAELALRAALRAAEEHDAEDWGQSSPEGEKAALRAGKRGKQE